MRKLLLIFIILIIIITIALVGYFIWYYFQGNQLTNNNLTTENSLATINGRNLLNKLLGNQPILKKITEKAIADYWTNASTSEVFLVNYDGKIEKISFSGQRSMINDQGLSKVSQFAPSPDGLKALINLTVFDTALNTWTNLPDSTTAAAWHPNDSQKIAYLKNDGLYLFNLKNGKSANLLKINNRDWQLSWPTADEIYLNSKPTNTAEGEVWLFNLKNKTLSKFISGESSPLIKWQGLSWGLKLNNSSIINHAGKELVNLNSLLPNGNFITLDSKCLAVEEGLHCAVPKNLPENIVLPDDYLKRKIYTNDDIYFVMIDIQKKTAQAKLLLSASENNPIDAINLSVMGNKLLFINRYDQKLYQLNF